MIYKKQKHQQNQLDTERNESKKSERHKKDEQKARTLKRGLKVLHKTATKLKILWKN